MEQLVKQPRYVNIAIDVAKRIFNDEFLEDDKIKGRSTLASYYNVSPETIRRSMSLLQDMQVLEVQQNSGIVIKSRDRAAEFISRFASKKNLLDIKEKIKSIIDQRNALNKEIDENISAILENCTQLKNIGLIKHYEYRVTKKSLVANKTVVETNFWHNTGATIIGAVRDNELLVSVGPYFLFTPGDLILFVGTEDVKSRVEQFCDK